MPTLTPNANPNLTLTIFNPMVRISRELVAVPPTYRQEYLIGPAVFTGYKCTETTLVKLTTYQLSLY